MTAPSDRRDAASTSAPPPPAATELSLDEAVRYAIGLQRSRQLDAAETLYRRVLQSAPEHPDALHYLGLLTFQRGRAESNVPGAGIGLAIVKSIADLHRGQLYAEARDGGGSCFRLTLPIDRPPKINFGDEN